MLGKPILLCCSCNPIGCGLQDWLDAGVALVTIIGGIGILYVYAKDNQRKRAEWMHQLYVKFFEDDRYKTLRRELDHDRITSDWLKNEENEEQLVDYLNFFEHIASLYSLRQISKTEIDRLFDYYLRLLSDHSVVRAYVKQWGFEDLDRLLTAREQAGRK